MQAGAVPLLGLAETTIVPLPDPETPELMDSHCESLTAHHAHPVPAVTLIVAGPPL